MAIHFKIIDKSDDEWKEIAESIEKVSWRAGKSLAEKMADNDFPDWERVIIGVASGNDLASFCTVDKEDGLADKSYTPFIGYVFVQEEYRGKRLSKKMLQVAENYLKSKDFSTTYIVSGEVGLYEKYGYTKIMKCETIHGEVENLFEKKLTN